MLSRRTVTCPEGAFALVPDSFDASNHFVWCAPWDTAGGRTANAGGGGNGKQKNASFERHRISIVKP
jgi:hypothetical protein